MYNGDEIKPEIVKIAEISANIFPASLFNVTFDIIERAIAVEAPPKDLKTPPVYNYNYDN